MSEICPNCGAERDTPCCGQCGQHVRRSRRLTMRDVAAKFVDSLFDLESAFPATLIALWKNPGRMCREYIAGRRQQYMNPFGYFLISVTVQVVLLTVLEWIGAGPGNSPEDVELSNDAATWLLLVSIVPFTVVWRWLFRSAGMNFAELYVFGLYLVAQFAWIETIFMLPLLYVTSDLWLGVLYSVIWWGLTTVGGVGFFRMSWSAVLWRMLVSLLFGAIVVVVVGGIGLELAAMFRAEVVVP